MKRFVLICFASLAVGGYSVAQEPATANPPETAPQELGLRTVVGCLATTGGKYVISGGGPGAKQFRIIEGDVSSLKDKLGHTVKVVGIVGKNDTLANQNGLYNSGSTTGVGYLTIDARKISDLYPNCSNPGREWSGEHK